MKNRIQKKVDTKKALLVKQLAATHNCTTVNVYKAINGHSVTENSIAIKKDYDKKYKAVTELLA